MATKVVYSAMVGEKHYKKFDRNSNVLMNNTWEKFNKYAKKKGFTTMVKGSYLGGMAWSNGKEIMELVNQDPIIDELW